MAFRGRLGCRNVQKVVRRDKPQFCITCLNTDCKLYPYNQHSLGQAYELLTGNTLQGEVKFEPKFCPECAHRLISCTKFRDKSLRAYHTLIELAEQRDMLTTDDIKTINNQYSSCLSYSGVTITVVDPGCCESSATNQDVKIEPKSKQNEDKHIIIETKAERNINKEENDGDNPTSDEVFMRCDVTVERVKSETGDDNERDSELNLLDDDSDIAIIENDDSGNYGDMDKNVKDTKTKKQRKRNPKINKGYKTSEEVQEMLKQFNLTKLTIEQQLADIETRKESSNYNNSVYKCDKCYKGFIAENTYDSHMKTHSKTYGQYLCAICKVYAKSASALRLHVKESHSTRYSCVSCSFITKHKSSAVNHARWHTGVKFKCELCTEEYDKKTSLLSHIRLYHPSDVACPFCGYCFVNQHGLRKHVEVKHRFDTTESVSGPVCAECDIRFANDTAYQQHVLVSPKHNTDGSHRNRPIGKHKRLSNTKIVECEQCGLQCKGYRLYYNHFTRLHPGDTPAQSAPQPYLCEQCGKAFKSRWTLRDHEQLHKSNTVFQCDICKSRYSLRCSLINHLKSHSKPQPVFECPICGKKFNNKANTNRHIMTHNDLRPFKCGECGKSFITASEQRAHHQHAHLKKPWPKKGCVRARASRRRDAKEPATGALLKAESTETED